MKAVEEGTRDTRHLNTLKNGHSSELRNEKKMTKQLSESMSKKALSLIKIEELSIYPIACSTVYRKHLQNA